MDLKQRLVREALDAGFVACRICKPDAVPEVPERLGAFLAAGHHGQMGWMEERVSWRGDPSVLWPEARSVIMLAESYAPEYDPLAVLEKPELGAVSAYAQGRDYHDVVKKRLKRLARWLIAQQECQVKVFVDTAPVPEKALAQAAGLGWQGKHTNVVSREWGNWAFLGSVFTTLELEPDEAEVDRCGSCTACQEVCPTNAFPEPYRLDARKCISYLTIEHKGPVDEELRRKLGNRIYGCDDCLAVCPWNKFAVAASDIRYHGTAGGTLAELVELDDAAFRARFSGSPVKRIGRDRFVRNVLYAIGNSSDVSLRAAAQGLCDDPDDTVKDAARWAVAQLAHL
ncbi:tRNA epoxyqueuosine(34) reductase QueG [Sulfitobacter sp. F26169L]|uniref:tRNA epoxyqueuosine(34) reductase QueG n=1 Tax=Sulfitobacter sp. F26169L TaxID=2996015 RepID=UPI002260F6AA|nr:tRNA epoxyqueuosine(34) reductase QueG [Sulfitobacter sp. F26169L]MCX7565991.1 tRNA epoxyqueuosine(34) reductase QueG [Sulfitobacter sp. F26169L]